MDGHVPHSLRVFTVKYHLVRSSCPAVLRKFYRRSGTHSSILNPHSSMSGHWALRTTHVRTLYQVGDSRRFRPHRCPDICSSATCPDIRDSRFLNMSRHACFPTCPDIASVGASKNFLRPNVLDMWRMRSRCPGHVCGVRSEERGGRFRRQGGAGWFYMYCSKKQEGTRTRTGPQEHRQTNGAPPQVSILVPLVPVLVPGTGSLCAGAAAPHLLWAPREFTRCSLGGRLLSQSLLPACPCPRRRA